MNLDGYRKRVLEIPMVQALSPDLKSRLGMILLWIAHEVEVPAGEVVYAQGADDENTGCVLLDGAVEISIEGQPVKTCSAPEIFGEMKQFTNDQQRTATVRVVSDATMLRFYWNDLVRLTQTIFSGDERLAILDVVAELAGRRLLEQSGRLD